MTTCPTCHGKDGLHGIDCGFTSGRPHMTHHDDCGCKSAAHERRIAALEADKKCAREDATYAEAALVESRKREWALERAREEDAIDHAGDVRFANEMRKQAETALAERDRMLRLMVGEYRRVAGVDLIISDEMVLAELRARAEEGNES